MVDRAKLNDRQLSLLKRVAEGDDLSGEESLRDRASAYALSNRGLIKISKHGGVFRAALTGAGRARITSEPSGAKSQRPRRIAESGAPSASKRRAPDATVEIANARAAQASELVTRLSVDSTFTVVQPTEDELATWREVVDFARRHGLVPEGKRLEKNITRSKNLEIMLLDGVHPNTKPATPSAETPAVRVPETLRACHPVVAKLRDDEHRLMMPKQQRRRCLLILQALAVEAQRRGHTVKDEPVEKKSYGYYGGYRARDGAISVKIDGFEFAVKITQVSPNSADPEQDATRAQCTRPRQRPRVRPCAHLRSDTNWPVRQASEAFVVTNVGFIDNMRIQAMNFVIHPVGGARLRQWAAQSQPAEMLHYPATRNKRAGAGAFGFARSVALCGVEG